MMCANLNKFVQRSKWWLPTTKKQQSNNFDEPKLFKTIFKIFLQ